LISTTSIIYDNLPWNGTEGEGGGERKEKKKGERGAPTLSSYDVGAGEKREGEKEKGEEGLRWEKKGRHFRARFSLFSVLNVPERGETAPKAKSEKKKGRGGGEK